MHKDTDGSDEWKKDTKVYRNAYIQMVQVST